MMKFGEAGPTVHERGSVRILLLRHSDADHCRRALGQAERRYPVTPGRGASVERTRRNPAEPISCEAVSN